MATLATNAATIRHHTPHAKAIMASQRTTVDALLGREARQSYASGDQSPGGSPSRLNAVWRQKVIQWYFTLIAALRQQHSAASSEAGNPFNRTTVHVTASLLDNYLMSLPSERALRYKRDRSAYQLLATTCLLLGMRLAQHDQIKESSRQQREEAALEEEQQGCCGLKRAKTRMMNMNEAAPAEAGTSTTTPPTPAATAAAGGVPMPNAGTILRISAAPKSISEQHVLSMVREMTGSRSFPRSKVVTALDFIQALGATSTQVCCSEHVSLGPEELEEACRLADASLRDMRLLATRPSAVACAAVTLALARSNSINLNMTSLRQQVYQSIFGSESDPQLQVAIRKAESYMISFQVGVTSSRNNARRVVPTITTHLIPLEDE